MITLITALGFGFVLGMRHALEPDHVAAVSTLVAERPSWRRGALLGAYWGLGHSAALFVLGGSLLLLRAQLPESLANGFELIVAFVLIALGARSLRLALRKGEGSAREHHHGNHQHTHATEREHVHIGAFTFARRPLVVGLAHGLAGSGALTAIAMASMPTTGASLLYVALFGVGSVGGMALLTGVAGWQLQRITTGGRARMWLSLAAGTFSLVLGIVWGSPILLRLCRVL